MLAGLAERRLAQCFLQAQRYVSWLGARRSFFAKLSLQQNTQLPHSERQRQKLMQIFRESAEARHRRKEELFAKLSLQQNTQLPHSERQRQKMMQSFREVAEARHRQAQVC